MQPVQRRGYAQGAAFQPIQLSDQGRKILEQNDQFLRGLQETQRLERGFEAAKIRQLQDSIQKQRQNLNENFEYDKRQRSIYKESADKAAAIEIENLKRAAAVNQDNPKFNTVEFVNDLADFLVQTSKTATQVIGNIRKERDQAETDLANRFITANITPQKLRENIGKTAYQDLQGNVIFATAGEAAAMGASGAQYEQYKALGKVNEGIAVRTELIKTEAEARLAYQNFEKIDPQEKFTLDDQQIELGQATPEQRERIREQYIQDKFGSILAKYDPSATRKITESLGQSKARATGQDIEREIQQNESNYRQFLEAQAVADPSPKNLNILLNGLTTLAGGDNLEGQAQFAKIAQNTNLVPQAAYEDFKNSSTPDQPNKANRDRFPHFFSELDRKRAAFNLTESRDFAVQQEIVDNEKSAELTQILDTALADGEIQSDEFRQEELSAIIAEAEAKGHKATASIAKYAISKTTPVIQKTKFIEEVGRLERGNNLTTQFVRDGAIRHGIVGQNYKSLMERAQVSEQRRAPTNENKKEAQERLGTILSNRLNYIDTTKGEPATLSTAKRRIMSIYNQSYANNIALTNDHVAAHKTAMGVAMDAIGDNPQEGLFRVPKALETLQGKTQDFVDPSLNYQSIDPEVNVLGQTFKALEQYPDERIYRKILIDPDAMREASEASRGRGVFQRIPQIEAVANSLNVPYHVAHNNFAEAQLLPPLDPKTYATADDTTTYLHSAGYGKFLTATADIDKRMYADLADIQNGGSGIYYKQKQSSNTGSPWRRPENMAAYTAGSEVYSHTPDLRATGDMMINYMTNDLNMSSNHAMGIYLNFFRESTLRTDVVVMDINGKPSGGLGQWNGPRYQKMRQVLGNNWTDHKAQIKYAIEEQGEPGQEYLNTNFATPLQAAEWWLRRWERSAHQSRDQQKHAQILREYNRR